MVYSDLQVPNKGISVSNGQGLPLQTGKGPKRYATGLHVPVNFCQLLQFSQFWPTSRGIF